jgi:two-component system response regulator LytT
MKCLIIEDEVPAALQLKKLLQQIDEKLEVVEVIDSVEGAVSWLRTFPSPDLIFMDIQLADGLSFDIFRQTDVGAPVIFTTAYDQYAIKAFKVKSVDYLLKPIQPRELEQAVIHFREWHQREGAVGLDHTTVQQLMGLLSKNEYKERFLVKSGQQLHYIPTSEAAYFFADEGLVFLMSHSRKKYPIDYSLDQLEPLLPPERFFPHQPKVYPADSGHPKNLYLFQWPPHPGTPAQIID